MERQQIKSFRLVPSEPISQNFVEVHTFEDFQLRRTGTKDSPATGVRIFFGGRYFMNPLYIKEVKTVLQDAFPRVKVHLSSRTSIFQWSFKHESDALAFDEKFSSLDPRVLLTEATDRAALRRLLPHGVRDALICLGSGDLEKYLCGFETFLPARLGTRKDASFGAEFFKALKDLEEAETCAGGEAASQVPARSAKLQGLKNMRLGVSLSGPAQEASEGRAEKESGEEEEGH